MSTQNCVRSPDNSQVELTPSEHVSKKRGRPSDDLYKYMICSSAKRTFDCSLCGQAGLSKRTLDDAYAPCLDHCKAAKADAVLALSAAPEDLVTPGEFKSAPLPLD